MYQRYLLLLSIVLIPAYIFRFRLLGVPTNLLEISIVVSGLIIAFNWLLKYLSGRDAKCSWGYLSAYFLLFFAAIGVLFSADKIVALGIFKGWFLVPVILYLLLINYFPKDRLREISLAAFISLMVVAVWAISQKLGLVGTLFYQAGDPGFADYLSRFRAFGPFESPNYLAMFIVPLIFISLSIFSYCKTTIDKLLIASFYIFPLYALYASHSLGGLLAFGFAWIAFLSFSFAKLHRLKILNSSWKLVGLSVIIVLVAAIFALIFASIGPETYSRSMRLDIYRYSWQLIKDHPIFGIGLGQFQTMIEAISIDNLGFQLYGLAYALHPHNLFLNLWLSLGLGGLISFLFLLVSFFQRLARSRGEVILASGLFAAMMAILIHGLIDTTYFKNDLSAIFWLILALSLLIEVKNVQHDSQKNN